MQHFLLRDKAHFQIQLGELRLPVGAQILITETAGNLEIPFHAGDHQQLFQLLRRLRQGIKTALLQAAGHQIIPRPLRRAFNQDGRLNFQKAPGIEKIPDILDYLMAQHQVALHLRPAQIQIAVLQPQAFLGFPFVGNVKGRGKGGIKHRYFLGHYLDRAGSQGRVFGAGGPAGHRALHRNDPLGAQLFGGAAGRRGQFRVEHHLHNAGTIPQVNENYPAVIPAAADPAGQGMGLADLDGGKVVAVYAFQRWPPVAWL